MMLIVFRKMMVEAAGNKLMVIRNVMKEISVRTVKMMTSVFHLMMIILMMMMVMMIEVRIKIL